MKRKQIRIVPDTNLFVASIFNTESASHRILEKAEAGELIAVWSPAIKKEVLRILRAILSSQNAFREGPRGQAFFEAFASRVFREEGEVRGAPRLRAVPDDPEDNKFVDAAVAGEADAVVSNDDHLLSLGSVRGVRILSPSAFLEEYDHGGNA